jgi:hypothetical protein
MSNEQLIHIWAQKTIRSKTCGNVSIKEGVLYSYAEPIGVHLPNGFTLISSYRFSNTTARHQSHARQAIPSQNIITSNRLFKPVLRVLEGLDSALIDELYTSLIAENIEVIDSLITKAIRARSNTDFFISQSIYATMNLMRFINNIDYTLLDSQRWILNLNSTVPDSQALKEFLESKGIDLKARQEKEKEANRLKKIKLDEQKREEQKRLLENIVEWKSGANVSVYGLDKIYLRFINDTIETTKGAQVPFKDALNLLNDVRLNNNIQGKRYGNFTGNEINENFVVIGCHSIPKEEILNLANQLGL